MGHLSLSNLLPLHNPPGPRPQGRTQRRLEQGSLEKADGGQHLNSFLVMEKWRSSNGVLVAIVWYSMAMILRGLLGLMELPGYLH